MIPTGEVARHVPEEAWVLIFGGVTREGNRRARRAARTALAGGLSVVWFDGYEESVDSHGAGRVPLDGAEPDAPVLVVGYAARERKHPLLRMLELPDSLEKPYLKEGSSISVARRRLLSRTVLVVRGKVLRRVSLIFRGVIGWRLVRPDVQGLAVAAPDPVQILFGDDFSLTQAWHAARIWPEVPTGMELTQR